ncbi:MAG TPA: SIS domain-containing protein [Chitinophagales bacterium]|nr:SIS domain-containing protein [Chitinophagales bacterium]
MQNKIKEIISSSISVKQQVLQDAAILNTIEKITDAIVAVFKNNGTVLLCGNGGSAADAQHLAAEFSGRFYKDREPLNAEALHVNTSYLTAVANDYSFNEVYARLVKAKGKKGDVLIALSTSGNSENIVEAAKTAKAKEMTVVAFTGKDGGKLKEYADFLINVPSIDTPRIQECHILVGHIICQLVEENYF